MVPANSYQGAPSLLGNYENIIMPTGTTYIWGICFPVAIYARQSPAINTLRAFKSGLQIHVNH